MKTRDRHQIIVWVATGAFMLAGVYFLCTSQMRLFLIVCGAYLAFLLIFSLICRFLLSRDLRMRPPMPEGFQSLKAGPITTSINGLIERSTLADERMFGKTRHRLFTSETEFPEGIWRCRIEEADNRIVACDVWFRSSASPVMDWGKGEGTGRFIVIQS